MSNTQITRGGNPIPSTQLSAVDNVTIGGDGSGENPLHTLGGGTAIVTNGTLTGNGTINSPLGTTPGGTSVTADDFTITGNGTPENPLVSTGTSFVANLPALSEHIAVGCPMYARGDSTQQLAQANSGLTAFCVGLVASVGGPAPDVQSSGQLTLTTAQWDARTGGSGGLTPGGVYYVSPTTAGTITLSAPSSPGTYVVTIGVARNVTTMFLLIAPPIANS